jgi:hypothetical protein
MDVIALDKCLEQTEDDVPRALAIFSKKQVLLYVDTVNYPEVLIVYVPDKFYVGARRSSAMEAVTGFND